MLGGFVTERQVTEVTRIGAGGFVKRFELRAHFTSLTIPERRIEACSIRSEGVWFGRQ